MVGAVLAAMLLAHQDVARAIERAALSPREGAWLRQVRELGIGPNDVVMTDVPTIVGWYVGGLDFWISSRDYEKYTTRPDDVRRDVHTGAVLVRQRSDFERLVGRPLAGQAVWVIASGRSYQWGELVDDDLKALPGPIGITTDKSWRQFSRSATQPSVRVLTTASQNCRLAVSWNRGGRRAPPALPGPPRAD